MLDVDLSLSDVVRHATARHEAVPAGVPTSIDWRSRARVGAGNVVPAGWSHIVGWGQCFRRAKCEPGPLELRGMQTWALVGDRWQLLQHGATYGEAFAPDYSGNAAAPAQRSADGVTWPQDRAYHWWHAERAAIPAGYLAVLVLVQARGPAGLLLGLGADYWQSASAVWDNHRTNCDAAIGRLRKVTPYWRTYAMTTASAEQARLWAASS